MKICLNSRCLPEYLEKADEIKIQYKDLNKLVDYVDTYPNVTFIFYTRNIPEDTELSWEEIERSNKLCKGQFIFAATTIHQINECLKREINFYLDKPTNNYEDLQWLKKMGAKYILIETPLFFDLQNVKKICGKSCLLRIAPNIAYYADSIPKENGICGSWIRPEDIEEYSKYIDTIEFEDCNTTKEQALYRVYMENHSWLYDLNDLITNLGAEANNLYIPNTFASSRLNCGQRCKSVSNCNICNRAFVLSNNKDFQTQLKKLGEKNDN